MSFTLKQVVPWGRNFDEYCRMFALTNSEFATRIMACGDGPASFNAEGTQKGFQIVSVDPIYRFPAREIDAWVQRFAPIVAQQTRRNADQFVWDQFPTVEDLIAARLAAMTQFFADYSKPDATERYVAASLPDLPFPDKSFDLALCSHFLFLYSEHFDADFHVRSILELTRVATEVRIFPLFELGSRPSRHLDAVIGALGSHGLTTTRVTVPYEFQKGANEMLKVTG